MQIRVRLGIAAALGLLIAAGSAFRAHAQVGTFIPNIYEGDGALYTFNRGGLQQVRLPPQGTWGEVITVNSRWMVVQNQLGQQFPIAADRVRQFLIRWPYSTASLTPNSVVEVTGPEAGSNVIIADHVDVYEADAQGLVSPADNILQGYNRVLTSFDFDQQNTYGVVNWMTPEEYALPSRRHVVGRAAGAGGDPIRIAAAGQNWYTIQPSGNGMSVTQVTIGNNTYARRGDVVYFVTENVGPRSLDVSQLVLYKKIPLRAFQP